MIRGASHDREKQVEDLENFTENVSKDLSEVLSTLGWTLESVSNDDRNVVVCPFDGSHRVPEEVLERHLEACQWKAEGYEKDEVPLSEPTVPPDDPRAVKFDEQLQDAVLLKAKEQDPSMKTAGAGGRLIPRTSDRLIADFTSDEKRALYDYVIAHTTKHDIGDDIADMNKSKDKDGGGPKVSFLELLAQERNLKRRRAKHRGVHTNKKSQLEILREVINQQMEMYVEYITDSVVKKESQSPGRSEPDSADFRSYDFSNNYRPPRSESSRSGLQERRSTRDSSRLEWENDKERHLSKSVTREPVSPELDDKHKSLGTSGRHQTEFTERKWARDSNYCDREKISDRHKSRERKKRSKHSDRRKDRSMERVASNEGDERRRSKDRKTRDKGKHRSRDKHDGRHRHRSRDRDDRKYKKYDDNHSDLEKPFKSKDRNRGNGNDHEYYEY